MNDFASKLSYYRSLSGLTQSELADKIGITTAQISRYETGNAIPRPKVRDLLAEALNVNPSDLTPVIDKQWSNQVKARMRQLRMSQSQLAEKLNVTQSSLANWLNGFRTPREEIIQHISEILDLSNNQLQSKIPTIKGWFSEQAVYPTKIVIAAKSRNQSKEATFNLLPTENQELVQEIKSAIGRFLNKNDSSDSFSKIVKLLDLSDIKLTFTSNDDDLPK